MKPTYISLISIIFFSLFISTSHNFLRKTEEEPLYICFPLDSSGENNNEEGINIICSGNTCHGTINNGNDEKDNTLKNETLICNSKACIIKPQNDDDTVVYARYSIQTNMEEQRMSTEDNLTKEDIKQIFDECIEAKLAPMQEQINTIIEAQETEPGQDDDQVKEMEAKIAELKKESATAKVDNLIAQGKIFPAKKETMVDLCASNPETFDELMKDAPVIIDLETRQSLLAGNSDDDDDTEPTPEEQNLQNVMAHFAGDD